MYNKLELLYSEIIKAVDLKNGMAIMSILLIGKMMVLKFAISKMKKESKNPDHRTWNGFLNLAYRGVK